MSIQKLTDSISKSLPDIIYVFTLCLFDFFPMCRRLEILFAYKIFFSLQMPNVIASPTFVTPTTVGANEKVRKRNRSFRLILCV